MLWLQRQHRLFATLSGTLASLTQQFSCFRHGDKLLCGRSCDMASTAQAASAGPQSQAMRTGIALSHSLYLRESRPSL
jgi:hypothetical protein